MIMPSENALNVQTLKVGLHRGNHRVWLDNRGFLTSSGFTVGCGYYIYFGEGIIGLSKNDMGIPKEVKERKVSGKGESPVVDLSSKAVKKSLGDAKRVKIEYRGDCILISPERG